MELFRKTRAVKLRGHLEKYLVAGDDQETVRQSRNSSGKRATWFVELVQDKQYVIRLKSCHGKYLTATDIPFLLGMTGKKVLQTVPDEMDWKLQWEPIRDGFQIKLKTWCGKFLRANGGTPPWRNSITHDEPHTGATQKWILWDLEVVQVPESEPFMDYLSSASSFSSVSDEVLDALSDDMLGSGPQSPTSVVSSLKSPRFSMDSTGSPKLSAKQATAPPMRIPRLRPWTGMDLFLNAKAVRLRSHHDKYLLAEEDEESVTQDRKGSSKNARWTVEFVPGSPNIIRLKSTYNRYLTSSNQPFLLGMTGRKVTQTLPRRLDSSVEWEPIREGSQVKLKTRYGNFLRANGGLPPWRNSVTHDIPHRTATQEWVLWDVHIVEIQEKSPANSLAFESTTLPSSVSSNSGNFSRQESCDSYVGSLPKSEGRTIYFQVADDSGEVDDEAMERYSFSFKGNSVDELTHKLKEQIGLENIVVCTRSPLNEKLFPLRLQLPPNNADMHVVVVPSASKARRDFAKQGIQL